MKATSGPPRVRVHDPVQDVSDYLCRLIHRCVCDEEEEDP